MSEDLLQYELNSQFQTQDHPTPLYSSVYKTYLAGGLKYKIVNFGIVTVPHFGHIASSNAEGSNSKLKERLFSSQLTVPQILEGVDEIIEEQFKDIIIIQEKGMINILFQHTNTGVFRYLVGFISSQAIRKMYNQY